MTKVMNSDLLFGLIDKDRTDIVIYNRLEGYGVIKKLKLQNIRVIEPPFAVREMFLYLNIRHIKIVPEIARILRVMKNDGTFSRISNSSLKGYLKKGENLNHLTH